MNSGNNSQIPPQDLQEHDVSISSEDDEFKTTNRNNEQESQFGCKSFKYFINLFSLFF